MPLFLRFYQLCDDNLRLAAAKDGGVGILEGNITSQNNAIFRKTGLGMDAEIVKADQRIHPGALPVGCSRCRKSRWRRGCREDLWRAITDISMRKRPHSLQRRAMISPVRTSSAMTTRDWQPDRTPVIIREGKESSWQSDGDTVIFSKRPMPTFPFRACQRDKHVQIMAAAGSVALRCFPPAVEDIRKILPKV